MYLPKHFQEARVPVLHELIRCHPLATLVTLTPEGLQANHIPLYLRVDAQGLGVLVGHVARANPVWKNADPQTAALVVFQGPHSYISPGWYPTKAEHGKVVPTWNYAVVQARGPLRAVDDAGWVRAQLMELTGQQESAFAKPWSVDDAPADYIEKMLTAIVGIEIPIQELTGKWKVSQNQPEVNQAGVVQGLGRSHDAHAPAMAGLVAANAKAAP